MFGSIRVQRIAIAVGHAWVSGCHFDNGASPTSSQNSAHGSETAARPSHANNSSGVPPAPEPLAVGSIAPMFRKASDDHIVCR